MARPGTESGGVRSALVGRADVLAVLRDVVGRATDFQAPQLVTVVGNQGVGKTRLVSELVAGLQGAATGVRVFRGRARAGDKLAAIGSLLRERFGIDNAAMAPPEQSAKVAAEVSAIFGGADTTGILYCLGGFLQMDFAPTPFLKILAENPKHRSDLAHTVFRQLVELDAQKGPTVLVFDDLQWADDETLDILTELVAGLGGSPVVVIAIARPEMLVRSSRWAQGAVDHERVDLRNLEPDDAEVMFQNLLARCGRIPDDLVQAALEMTGGNPAFLEQLVRLYLAAGAIDTSGTLWKLDLDAALAVDLPISIEEAIEARIATLEPDERELLERAAVFGNVFWLSAVVALTRLEDPRKDVVDDPLDLEWGEGERIRRRLTDLVGSLAERDYLLVLDESDSTMAGDVEIVFKHNLEREVVMKTTPASRLAAYHLAAAQWLEGRIGDKSEEQLEFLTGLYERGGDLARAARCYLLGADRARARYAHEEARQMYERGLSMLESGDAPARMDALHNLGDVLDLVGETDLALERFGEMLELAWRFDNQGKAGAAHSRIARVMRRHGKYDPAMRHLNRAQELFSRAHDDRGIASTMDDIGRVHWLRGAYGQALDFHRQALTLRKALGDRRSIALSLANIGRVHCDSGNFKAAIAQFREALDLRRDINDLTGVVQSLCDLAGVYHADGNHGLALELLSEAQEVGAGIGDMMVQAEVLSRLGEAKTAVGLGEEAAGDLAQARDLARVVGDRVMLAETHCRAAECDLARGDATSADREARTALTVGESVGARVQIGKAHRTLAAVAVARGDVATAEAELRRSIDILGTMRNELEL
ncbi:MAG: tetratricopeptide repeat protein, partial [Deltaproteobacteria bacterium]|nr:tetratricopeptide repeat protein [Kofleriaceae bacterium]